MRMPALLVLLVLLASAASGPVLAAHADGPGPLPSPIPLPGDSRGTGPAAEDVARRLERDVEHLAEVQAKFDLQSEPQAASALALARNFVEQARQALAAGNTAMANALCDLLENQLTFLKQLGNRTSMERLRSGPVGGIDTSRLRQDQQIAAESGIRRVADRLAFFANRPEAAKQPQAVALIEKAQRLLDAARREAELGRVADAAMLVTQADLLVNELQRLMQVIAESDPRREAGPSPNPFNDRPPQAAAQADAQYQRVFAAAQRLGERTAEKEDPKSADLRKRVFELLEKAKEALADGRADAAKGYCLKAEGLLAEWHRSLAGEGRLSAAARERVKAKLDLAGDIVSASGSDKAARILEKARDHFERAEQVRAGGRSALATVEMDLALKLAAKAVDIARSSSR